LEEVPTSGPGRSAAEGRRKRGNGCPPDLGRPVKKEGRRGREKREEAGGRKWASRPKVRERGRMNRNSFSFSNLIFQIHFQKIFKCFWHLNKTRHHIKNNAAA
jgi:hypothetical protein